MDADGRSMLWHAAASGQLANLAECLSAGLDPSAGDKAGLTPLHVAAQNGHLEATAFLLLQGANANAHDKYGNGPLWTATHHACLAVATDANLKIVEALLQAGANPDHRNVSGRSPLDISIRSTKVRAVFERHDTGIQGEL
ncbi:ankyrin repeat domain-containing protein [Dyella flava]|uniref:Ankyrin repeat domain-containing protein n=1 Tax=Dyella flava TaxID=1920170 RepID=A0ABS2K1S0_9GAMM|nr:ankyrin repeat domain-containing protein [Dyella flava]